MGQFLLTGLLFWASLGQAAAKPAESDRVQDKFWHPAIGDQGELFSEDGLKSVWRLAQ